jgi:hypothetical protein
MLGMWPLAWQSMKSLAYFKLIILEIIYAFLIPIRPNFIAGGHQYLFQSHKFDKQQYFRKCVAHHCTS